MNGRDPGEGDAPLPDVAKREALNCKLADARAKAEAARRAEAGLTAERNRELSKLPGLLSAIDAKRAEVLSEEAGDLIAGFIEAQRAVAANADRILAARDMIFDLSELEPPGTSGPQSDACGFQCSA